MIRPSKLNRTLQTSLFLIGAALLPVPGRAQSGYTITTIAGNATAGFSGDGGAAKSAQLSSPVRIAVDSSGTIYISDQLNQRIRKVSDGNISTFAGNGTAGYTGDGGAATSAELNVPSGLAVDGSGNLYIASANSDVIRKVTSSGTISTVAGDNSLASGYSGDGADATKAQLNGPVGVAVDSAGNIYIADTFNHVIRKVASGTITTVAGNTYAGYKGDGGPATGAQLSSPRSVAVDAAGNLYIADTGNNVIRKVSPSGTITTVAGVATMLPGYSGDGQDATRAQLSNPTDIAVDAVGNLYIADCFNARVRRVAGTNGIITTIAGVGKFGYSGDGGDAARAGLAFPSGVAVGADGAVYIADTGSNVVRKLTPPATVPGTPVIAASGVISAGSFGAFSTAAPGSWIEIYGKDLAGTTRNWSIADFYGVYSPVALGGTTVTVGGHDAYVAYVSPKQVNVIVPGNLGPGQQQVIVSTLFGTSEPYTLELKAREPGLFAPGSFNIGGKQYVGAVLPDGAWALPAGKVNATPAPRPAKPGDAIVLYGTGFGPVSPNVPVGQIAQRQNTLTSTFEISIGGMPAQVQYKGLIPGQTGVYGFSVIVPNVPASNDATPVTFTLDGVNGTQTLYTAIQLP